MDNLVKATKRNPAPKAAGGKLSFSSHSINVSSGVTVDFILLGPDYFSANPISLQLLGQEDSVDFSLS